MQVECKPNEGEEFAAYTGELESFCQNWESKVVSCPEEFAFFAKFNLNSSVLVADETFFHLNLVAMAGNLISGNLIHRRNCFLNNPL